MLILFILRAGWMIAHSFLVVLSFKETSTDITDLDFVFFLKKTFIKRFLWMEAISELFSVLFFRSFFSSSESDVKVK